MQEENKSPEQQEQSATEYQKMIHFSILAAASTLVGIMLFVVLGAKAWIFCFFIPTIIWMVMAIFFYFEKFLDWLKYYLDNRKNNGK